MKKSKSLVLALSLLGVVACGDKQTNLEYSIIPLPNEITASSGNVIIAPGSKFMISMCDSSFSIVADQLKNLFVDKYNLESSASSGIKVSFVKVVSDNPEAYTLRVAKNEIIIEASAANGAFYAFQTLTQMLPVRSIYSQDKKAILTGVVIKDEPRFGYRGTHLDVARHYVTTDSVKRFIDVLAMHKVNTFHWHLTEDQGWRLEIKKYPKLTEVGSKRARTVIGRNTTEYDNTPHQGFYTQDEVRDIVKYAAERYITIIPEIDLPGHMLAALASYPELGCVGKNYKVAETWGVFDDVLCAGNPKTLPFIYDIFDEVLDLFPSKYIHIGGDECPKVRWEKCPKCQAKIKELGLKKDSLHSAEERLQSYITKSVEKYLNDRGRALLGWDEIIEGGLSSTATVMAWRGTNYAFEAAKTGNNAILSPTSHCYFDYYQSDDFELEPLAIGGCIPLERAYSFQPIPENVAPEIASHILGVQANIWTEYIKTFKHVEYMLLPRLAAMSEAGWSDAPKDYDNFLSRLTSLSMHYDEANYNYARHIFDVRKKQLRDSISNKQVVELTALKGGKIHYTTDGSEPTEQSTSYINPIEIDRTMELKAKAFRQGNPSRTLSQSYSFNKATLKPIKISQPSHGSFTYEGASLLNDGVTGQSNYRSGRWMGFNNNDLSATIDLLENTTISEVAVGTFVLTGDWIFRPTSIVISVSDDGVEYKELKREMIQEAKSHVSEQTKHQITFNPTETRYVRVDVNSLKQMPEWHPGKGKPAFLFVDEISII
ncbi:MAG: glycoside hydrolase family 20 protein [Bacteroidales bacterium]